MTNSASEFVSRDSLFIDHLKNIVLENLKNEQFVSQGDIEVALHLYRLKGLDFLSYLNGMYACAISSTSVSV